MNLTLRLALLMAGPFAAVGAGFALGLPLLLPILGASAAWPVFVLDVRARRNKEAYGSMLLWALFQTLAVAMFLWLFPERGAAVVINGPAYAQEMLHWVSTGEGPEGSPALFLPVHAKHFVGFCALSALTAGAAGLALGTFLLNYMNFYVVELVRAAADPGTAAALAWPVWAIIRVLGYIAAAIPMAVLSLNGLRRIRGGPPLPFPWKWLALGLSLVLLDIALKASLASAWRGILNPALGA